MPANDELIPVDQAERFELRELADESVVTGQPFTQGSQTHNGCRRDASARAEKPDTYFVCHSVPFRRQEQPVKCRSL